MTREEARKAAEVMLAYADGKTVEYNSSYDDGKWREDHSPVFDWTSIDYRIKKEPTYRPFETKEECLDEMAKHQPFGWVKKSDNVYYNIYTVSAIGINIDDDPMFYNEAFKECVFIDETPFGIINE